MKLFHLIPVAALGLCFAIPVLSQEGTTRKAAVVAQTENATKTKEKTVRLPNNFGKIDLTDEQKDQVRGTLAKYNAQIEALEEQILALREKRDAEVRAVLTDKQKAMLTQLENAAKNKKAASKSNATKPATDE
jgi:hypothetical protein